VKQICKNLESSISKQPAKLQIGLNKRIRKSEVLLEGGGAVGKFSQLKKSQVRTGCNLEKTEKKLAGEGFLVQLAAQNLAVTLKKSTASKT